MVDNSTLAQVASIIAGFGATMLFFRIQREMDMAGEGEQVWMPWADWLLISATLIALVGSVLPVIITIFSPTFTTTLVRASCASATILLAGYIPSILTHYRLILGKNRSGPRDNPEPAERAFVLLTVFTAFVTVVLVILGIV